MLQNGFDTLLMIAHEYYKKRGALLLSPQCWNVEINLHKNNFGKVFTQRLLFLQLKMKWKKKSTTQYTKMMPLSISCLCIEHL